MLKAFDDAALAGALVLMWTSDLLWVRGAYERAMIAASLEAHLQALRDAVNAGEAGAAWRGVRDVLGWLYRLEEAVKGAEAHSYYADRAADPDGQTLAGLIWVRGLADHRQAELEAVVLKRAGTFVKQADGSLAPALVYVNRRTEAWR